MDFLTAVIEKPQITADCITTVPQWSYNSKVILMLGRQMKKECYITTVINQKNNPETNQCLWIKEH